GPREHPGRATPGPLRHASSLGACSVGYTRGRNGAVSPGSGLAPTFSFEGVVRGAREGGRRSGPAGRRGCRTGAVGGLLRPTGRSPDPSGDGGPGGEGRRRRPRHDRGDV